mmetsp:Transcript_45167/g.101421  ORF Transcript_45167/g.101421 Transcript_45167/m.101421 type:complete len:255 (+) Transcript_45167:310-1074(+)
MVHARRSTSDHTASRITSASCSRSSPRSVSRFFTSVIFLRIAVWPPPGNFMFSLDRPPGKVPLGQNIQSCRKSAVTTGSPPAFLLQWAGRSVITSKHGEGAPKSMDSDSSLITKRKGGGAESNKWDQRKGDINACNTRATVQPRAASASSSTLQSKRMHTRSLSNVSPTSSFHLESKTCKAQCACHLASTFSASKPRISPASKGENQSHTSSGSSGNLAHNLFLTCPMSEISMPPETSRRFKPIQFMRRSSASA